MDNEILVQKILAGMKEKYNEEFTLNSIVAGQAGSPYCCVMTNCPSYPGAEIIGRIRWNDERKSLMEPFAESLIEDNFMAYYFGEAIEERLRIAVKQIYSECKIYYKPSSMILPTEYSKMMKVEDFLSKMSSMIGSYIYLPPQERLEDKEVKAGHLRKELLGRGYAIKGLLCYLNQADCYQSLSSVLGRSVYLDKQHVKTVGIFSHDPERDEYVYLRWR